MTMGQPVAGRLIIDLAGTTPTSEEIERLRQPVVGGVILFSRNYVDREQLAALCAGLHALRSPPLLIAVDHEGGRVQRFRDGFTRLPAMRRLGEIWQDDAPGAVRAAQALGFVLAAELRACGVDLSFAPVLDLDRGLSTVIGERAFHRRPEAVVALAGALIAGMRAAGMACCGKHFPGHGGVAADSHSELPRDERPLAQLAEDIEPFRQLASVLTAVMPAHVVYPAFDAEHTAGFSPRWLGHLRRELGFSGAIFSDDLSMAGAGLAGDIVGRCRAADAAGCDMLLICNDAENAARALRAWTTGAIDADRAQRLARLRPSLPALSWEELPCAPLWQEGRDIASRLIAG